MNRVPDSEARISGPSSAKVIVARAIEDSILQVFPQLCLWKNKPFEVGEHNYAPDLWDPSEQILVEVKAALQGKRWYLTEKQLQAYLKIEYGDSSSTEAWPLQRARVSYILVTYKLQKPPGKYRKALELYQNTHIETSEKGWGIQKILSVPAEVLDQSTYDWGVGNLHVTPLSPILGAWEPYRKSPQGKLWGLLGEDPKKGVETFEGYEGSSWNYLNPSGSEIKVSEIKAPAKEKSCLLEEEIVQEIYEPWTL